MEAARKYRRSVILICTACVLTVSLVATVIVKRNTTLPTVTSPLPSSSSTFTETSVPQSQPEREESSSANRSSTVDPKDVQKALTELTENKKTRESQPQQVQPSSVATSSDQYPGSQRLELKDVDLPNIGVPYSNEVYGTTDSVSTVVAYYSKRYPDAQIMDVNGQKVIASEHTGSAKVIAVGTTGSETRIAIIKTN